MPFKNEARYLRETLESIIQQTEERFELIAVNDHSNDNSVDILQQYEKIDSRIHMLNSVQHGIIPALQIAHQNASGRFITRHDADDIMPSHKLYELKTLLSQVGRGHVATGRVEYFSDTSVSEGFVKYANWLNSLCGNNNHQQHLFKECVIASPNWMMFMEDFNTIDAFDESIYPEDYHMVFKLFEQRMTIVSSKKTTHLWRDHPLRASRTSEHYKDQKFFPLKIDFFKKMHGENNLNLWGAGPSGKKLAKILLEKKIAFNWVTNNEKKIGQHIYGIEIHHFKTLKEKINENLIISVTQKNALEDIVSYLHKINFKNYFEF